MPEYEEREDEPGMYDLITKPIKIAFAILTVIFFVTLVGFWWIVHDIREISRDNVTLSEKNAILTEENAKRISEIQASRIASCRQTYKGIDEVFQPFIKPPSTRTPEQQANIDKFNKTIEDLKAGCTKQTKPKKKVKPAND